MQNTLTDLPTRFNLNLFRGRPTVVELTVSETVPMPASVTAQLLYSWPGKPLPTALQPELTVTGQVIHMTFAESLLYPSLSELLIRFDGTPVLFGTVATGSGTVNDASNTTPIQVTVTVADAPALIVLNLPDSIATTSENADRAEAAAAFAESAIGNIMTFVGQDDISVTLGLGTMIQYEDHPTATRPYLTIIFP